MQQIDLQNAHHISFHYKYLQYDTCRLTQELQATIELNWAVLRIKSSLQKIYTVIIFS